MRKIIFILFIVVFADCKSQSSIKKYDKAYYYIINKTVLRDTILSDFYNDYWRRQVEIKEKTLEEIKKIKDLKLINSSILVLKQSNLRLKTIIEKELSNYKKHKPLIKYFGEDKLRKGLKRIQPEGELETNKLDSYIKIYSQGDYGWQFSSPIIIDNKILIYYVRFDGRHNMISAIIVYSIDDIDNPKPLKSFYESMS